MPKPKLKYSKIKLPKGTPAKKAYFKLTCEAIDERGIVVIGAGGNTRKQAKENLVLWLRLQKNSIARNIESHNKMVSILSRPDLRIR